MAQPSIHVEVLLTETELAEQFAAAWRQRFLDEKFFYWFPLSVLAWLELCRGNQPYRNYSRSQELVRGHAAEIAGKDGGGSIELVGLGAGQGDKDLLLLESWRQSGRQARYLSVDASLSLLELGLAAAAGAGFPARGLKADLASAATFQALAGSAGEPRLYAVLGNTLGVIHPLGLLDALGSLLRPQDRLLVDGEVFDPQGTLAGYDNPVNRRFAFSPLAAVGLEEGRDGTLVFESGRDEGEEGLHVLSKHFRPARRLDIVVAGRRIELAAGEKVAMHGSYKYSLDAFPRILRRGGFRLLEQYRSQDARFLMALAAPGAA